MHKKQLALKHNYSSLLNYKYSYRQCTGMESWLCHEKNQKWRV